MSLLRHIWLLLALAGFSGCCCVQGVSPCGDCGMGPCGSCGPGPLATLASCRGACGEVYVDEWISEPPVVDDCGYDCGGCGVCNRCRPVRSVLKLLWGRPYYSACSSGLCGPSCGDPGCDACGGEMMYSDTHGGAMVPSDSSCNCGQHHAEYSPPMHSSPAPQAIPQPVPGIASPGIVTPSPSPAPPAETIEVSPEVVPTPVPESTPSSASRLSPVRQRARIRRVSTGRVSR